MGTYTFEGSHRCGRSEFYGLSGSQRYTACNALHLISRVIPQSRRLTCARSERAGAQSRLSVTDESLDQGGDEMTLAYKRAEVLFNSVAA
jgi:hypothetical protein